MSALVRPDDRCPAARRRLSRIAGVAGAALALLLPPSSGCRTVGVKTAVVATIFGPVVGAETISGRIDDEREVVMMVGGDTLVSMDVESRVHRQSHIRLPGRERCWGLARLADGTLWTLLGRSTILQIHRDGSVARQVDLPSAQMGIFAAGADLVLQPASQLSHAPALFAGPAGGGARVPWSAMTTRPFDGMSSGAAAALNLVACGTGAGGEVPCWFPDEPAVFLITASGKTRRVDLAGLSHPAPEMLINASAPDRPVRDVFVEPDGTMWVISTGKPSSAKDLPGGWLLARYGPHGEPIDRRVLPQPARVILRASHGRAFVLTGSGMVAEVEP